MKFTQNDFSGGMDLKSNDTAIAPTAYRYLINGRQRFGNVEPIKDSVLINAPEGKKQGIIGIGTILILFCEGNAYYQVLGTNQWIKIRDFNLDSDVEYIYSIGVSSSTLNYPRKLNANNDASGTVTISSQFTISGTPSGLLCQDGINQPWIIFYEPSSNSARARRCKTYDQWTNNGTGADQREYVPVGTLMFTFGAITFILDPDGFTWLRSVSGRPLDFMVNIDTNGNKLATESLGGARSTSFSCGFNQCTYIGPLDSTHFLIGTVRNSYAVSLNTTNTFFGEPTFDTPEFLPTGIVNQFSVTDILADLAFIGFDGAKTFNGVQQFKFSGRNDPFSLKISSLLVDAVTNDPIRQSTVACCTFNDYAIFSIKTKLGYVLCIYDTIPTELIQSDNLSTTSIPRGHWVSLDITGAVKVKQFASTSAVDQNLLFCITGDDKVYQLYAGSSATAILRTRGYITGDAQAKHKSNQFRAIFEGITSDGQLQLTEQCDDIRANRYITKLTALSSGVKPPIIAPVRPDTSKNVYNATVPLKDGSEESYKIAYILAWNGGAKLTLIQAETTGITTNISKEQIAAGLSELLTANT